MRRFYIDPLELAQPEPRITGKDARHIRKVLRLPPHAQIRLIDGTGRLYNARIEGYEDDAVRVSVLDAIEARNESSLEIIVALGFLKERKMEDLIRPLTELGVSRIIPMITHRTVARPDPKRMEKRLRRWEAIAIESLKQCGRAVAPDISPATDFAHVLDMASQVDLSIFFWERDATPLTADTSEPPGSVLILLGPEGGFSEDEAEQAGECGCRFASLGPRILRAETAAVTACALTQYLWGDIKKSP